MGNNPPEFVGDNLPVEMVSTYKVLKGGGWLGDVSCCELSFRGKFEANGIGPDSGLRVARNK